MEQQLVRWKEHYIDLLNGPGIDNYPHIERAEPLDINTGPTTKPEIVSAVNKTKQGKAPGPDSIPPKALKANQPATTQIMDNLLNKFWESEQIPKEWHLNYIVKLPKKGAL